MGATTGLPQIGRPKIGLLGFGEVAHIFADGLLKAGVPEILACARRPKEPMPGVRVTTDPALLAEGVDVILSLVTASTAVEAARSIGSHLTEKHLYIDLNSVAPDTKIGIGKGISAVGARFVEGTIMGAVPNYGLKAPILLCGEHAGEAVAVLKPLGMVVEDIGPELGKASAVKMFRSIIIKGMEALLQECVLGADRYGAADQVLDSITEAYGTIDWNNLASYLISRTALHGNRRAAEMDEVAATLKALGIEPIMAEATGKRIRALEPYGLKGVFGDKAPKSYRDVLNAIAEKG